MLSIFWPHVRENVLRERHKLLWLGVGLVEAAITRHYLLKADTVVRDGDKVTMYIVARMR
jgi:hypothetical protein